MCLPMRRVRSHLMDTIPQLRAILLDWGGTLMREIPGFDGPMSDWPWVEAIPGAREALSELAGRYTLAVATNALASDEDLVRKALARAGLESAVRFVFTARDLGIAKPDPRFFRTALATLGLKPAQVVMVGDSYHSDVAGAKAVGLRAIWFNPAGEPSPLVHPVHDAEIRALQNLPAALSEPLLPDIPGALQILREHAVPKNIIEHSVAVAAVAHRIALRLRESGVEVNPLLVHRGGLLHDLDKLSSEKPTDHGVRAGQILRARAWPLLAAIAERHVLGAQPETWEEKLVHYADKIVQEDQVVGLVERVTALSCRYVSGGRQIAQALPQLLALEEEIVRNLRVARDVILAEVQALDLGRPPFAAAPGAA